MTEESPREAPQEPSLDLSEGPPARPFSPARLTRLACLAIVSMGFGINLAGAALPQIRAELGLPASAGGWLMSAYSIGFFLGVAGGARLADRRLFRRAMLLAGALYAVNWALMGRLPWPASNYALQFGAGLGGGLFQAALNTLVIVLHGARSARVLNVVHAFVSVGTIVGPIGLSAILALGGRWQTAFLLAATVPAAVFLWTLAERFPPAGAETPGASGVLPPRPAPLLREPDFGLLAGAMVAYIAAEFAVNVWIAMYLTETVGFPDWVGKWSLSAYWLALGAGRLLNARFVDAWGALPVLTALSAASLLTFVLAVAAGGHWSAPGLFFLYGLACSGIFPTLLAAVGNRFPERAGSAVSLLCAIGTIGSGVVPPAMGAAADAFGLRAAMALHVPYMVATIACVAAYRRRAALASPAPA